VTGLIFISSQTFTRPDIFLGFSLFLFLPKILFSEFIPNPKGFSFVSLNESKILTGIYLKREKK